LFFLDFQQLWTQNTAAQQSSAASSTTDSSSYPMTLAVIRRDFAEQYPDAVRAVLARYREAIEWTNANPDEAGVLVETYKIGLQAPVAAAAIPSSNLQYTSAAEGRESIEELFSLFLSFAPEAVGGALPDDGFYFE
jgi:NitT/TauT family transport system substrate-binding protein